MKAELLERLGRAPSAPRTARHRRPATEEGQHGRSMGRCPRRIRVGRRRRDRVAGGIPTAARPIRSIRVPGGGRLLALILGVALLVAIAVYLVVERIQTGTIAPSPASSHPHLRPHADRDRVEHHPGPDRRRRAEDPDLPRLDRHDPRRRARRPVAGAATGLLANMLWAYVIPPPFQYPPPRRSPSWPPSSACSPGSPAGRGCCARGRSAGRRARRRRARSPRSSSGGLAYLAYLGLHRHHRRQPA